MNDNREAFGQESRLAPEVLPFVSVIVPTYRSARTLDLCLGSLISQTYPPSKREIWVVDAFSNDGTIDVALRYGVQVHQVKGNPPRAYNSVIPHCRGSVLALADSDAYYPPEWMETLVRKLQANPSAAGVGGMCETLNDSAMLPRLIGLELESRYRSLPTRIHRIATMNVVYRKDIVEQVGGFDERLDVAYDTEIGHRITSSGFDILYEPAAVIKHQHRETLRAYARQQFTYGKHVLRLLARNPKLAKGDEVTPWWFYGQPLVLAIAIAFVLLGFLGLPTLLPALAILGCLTLLYVASAGRIALRTSSPDAFLLVPLYFLRAVAWLAGGLSGFATRISGS